MTVTQAREELAQYVAVFNYSGCPAKAWGFRYGTGWYPSHKAACTRRVSLQLCLSLTEVPHCDLPSPQAYAAQANWTRLIRRLVADAGRSVRRLARQPAGWPYDLCTVSVAEQTLIRRGGRQYDDFRRACERAGYTLSEVMVPTRPARTRRQAKATA